MSSTLRGRTLWPAVFATLLAVLPSETRSQTTTDPYVGFTSARALEQGLSLIHI